MCTIKKKRGDVEKDGCIQGKKEVDEEEIKGRGIE
jgi:hypothetical protein